MAVRWEAVETKGGGPGSVEPGPTKPSPVKPSPVKPSSAKAEWEASQRRFVRGWRAAVLIFVPLIYVIYVGAAVNQYSHGASAFLGYAVLGAFCSSYVVLIALVRGTETVSPWHFWPLYGLMLALFIAEVPFARAPAFVLGLYLVMIGVAALGARAAPIVAGLTLASIFVPVLVPSWHQTIGSAISNFTPIAIPVAAVITFVVSRGLQGALELAEARAELARLAAENERNRIARDLHDLLGHSLTTITVKAGLARRLAGADPARAAQEIAEVEALSRQALTDVRSAVSSYREVTLAGELARGRELLRASGIAAELPTAADVVGTDHQELFGWAVREGLTNVARHAGASTCCVKLSASEVEIVDDGVGGKGASRGADDGNGLTGLRERAAAAGGTVEAGPAWPRGWRLRVALGGATAAQ